MRNVVSRVIVEIIGAPKEHVDSVVEQVVDSLKDRDGVKLLTSKTFEPAETENKLWSGFCEMEIQTSTISKLMDFCFDFMPSSVEILHPTETEMKAMDVQNLMNDMLGRLHHYNTIIKTLHAENTHLKSK